MSTTFGELKRQVLLRMPDPGDGKTILAVEQGINEAHKAIARVRDFDELTVLDTANASTVANQSLYHIIDDLGLARPKDILTIRYMDEANSRKLTYVPVRELDERIPYTELFGTGKPSYYTRRGMYIELFRIPDEAKPLYILHTQWPATLSNDSDTTPYSNLDDVICTLATEIATSILEGGAATSWTARASALLGLAISDDMRRPDRFLVARPFSAAGEPVGKYWLNPWIRKEP